MLVVWPVVCVIIPLAYPITLVSGWGEAETEKEELSDLIKTREYY